MSCSDCDGGLLADGLIRLGGRGVEERDGAFTTYLPPPDDPDRFVQGALTTLKEHIGHGDLDVEWRWQRQEDWEELWKRGLAPRRVGPRIVIHPSWMEPDVGPGDVVIQLDPGMAFGTAEHGTTRGCLRLLDGLIQSGETVLDVGTGSGVLAIAAALLGAETVHGVETDGLACHAARDNAAVNGVAHRLHIEEKTVDAAWLSAHTPVDGVVANLETHLLLPLLGGLWACRRPDGWMILSGILGHERDQVVEAVVEASRGAARLVDEDRDGEWWSGAFRA